MGGVDPFQLSDRMSWNMDAAVGTPHWVCPAGMPLIVAELELYWTNVYQTTLPTVTEVGAVKLHPVGAVAPVVFAGVEGGLLDWDCCK